jgi:hypothetical protein
MIDDEYCTAMTKAGSRCTRAVVLLGVEHCFQHLTDEEKEFVSEREVPGVAQLGDLEDALRDHISDALRKLRRKRDCSPLIEAVQKNPISFAHKMELLETAQGLHDLAHDLEVLATGEGDFRDGLFKLTLSDMLPALKEEGLWGSA